MELTMLTTLEFDKIRAKLADCTGSVIGRELAESLSPVSDYLEVTAQLTETKEALDILSSVNTMPLGGIRDIRSIVKRAELGAVLEPHELVAVGSTLYAARRVKQFFSEFNLEKAPHLITYAESITVYRNLEINIDNTISEQGTVKDSASSELARLRREIRVGQQRIKEKLDHILHSTEYHKFFQDVLVTIRGDRYVIPVKQEYRHSFPGIVHDQSASGATVFIEPMAVVNLNNDLKQLMSAEHNEIERILQQLSSQVAVIADGLLETCKALGELDFIFAKARLSITQKAVMPLLNNNGIINLRQARHPLIPSDIVVPIDIELGNNFNVLVITGPNTGGKTVSLKTVGLFALMVQSGLFIPAAIDSSMPVFKNVFADIGDEQSIEQSLSTFSAHMTNLVRILKQVSTYDLVLIDEIGAGTDPDEGAALAMSILEYLHENNVRTIATTHYSELKTFAYSHIGIENASVEFDVQTLKPAYRLQIGMPGSSKAFLISQRLGLSNAIIKRAEQLVDEDHAEFDKVLTSLEEKRELYQNRQTELEELQRKVKEVQQSLYTEQDKFEAKKSEIIGKARDEAAQILRQAKREAEDVITQLKAQFSTKSGRDRQQAIETARQQLKDSFGSIRKIDDTTDLGKPATIELLTPGTPVYVPSLGQKGVILSLSGEEAIIQLGIMKLNIPAASCRLLEENLKKTQEASRSGIPLSKATDTPRQIDIRGMNITEAEDILGKYLDDAILAGLSELIIIHGKGTGVLRKGVRAYLKAHRNVKETQIGEINQGGDGVTVVKLK